MVSQYHINNTTIKSVKLVLIIATADTDWPRRQCLGRLYVSAIFSVARKSSSAVVLTPALILTRLAWQAYVSVIYVS